MCVIALSRMVKVDNGVERRKNGDTDVANLFKQLQARRAGDLRVALRKMLDDAEVREEVINLIIEALERWKESNKKSLLEKVGLWTVSSLIAASLGYMLAKLKGWI
jgi:hypothetical protein